MEYLGFWVTHKGVKHTEKNTSNKNIKLPTSWEELRQFIGLGSYYCNIWARLSYALAALTIITSSKMKFKWNKIKQDSFEEI